MSSFTRTLPAIAAGLTLSVLAACSSSNNTASDAPTAETSTTSSTAGSPSTPAPTTPSTSTSASTEIRYRDGSYTAKGWYGGGPSSIDVEVTLDDDLITAVVVTPNATDPTSLDYQNRFAGGVSQAVVGRHVDDVELDRVAGSSTTPDGFNDALRQIRSEAAA